MADEVIAIKISVDAADSANSVKDLKKAIKDLENAALSAGNAGDEALSRKYAAAAGAAKDKMADFKKEIAGVQDAGSKLGAIANVGATIASGFQAAQGAAALFGSSGKDVEKVLLKVQAATALAQGAQALANATEDIAIAKKVVFTTVTNIASAASTAFGVSTAAAMAIATAGITVLVGAVIGLVAYLSSATAASEKLAEQEKKRKEQAIAADKFQEDFQLKAIENEFKLAQAEGKSADEILAIKKRLLNEKISIIKEEENALETTTERSRVLSLQRLDLENEIAVEDATRNRQRIEDAKKTSEELAKIKQQELEDRKKQREQETDIEGIKSLTATTPTDNPVIVAKKQENAELDALNTNQAAKDLILQKKVQNAKIASAALTLTAISDLTALFGGKNEKAARRAFEINKAAQIGQAIISTYQGANAIFASAAANPATVLFPAQPFIAAGAAIISGLANVAKISSQKFDGGGSGGAGSPSVPSLSAGGGGGTATPSGIPTAGSSQITGGGQITNLTGNQDNKVYVTETDITKTINRVKVIETRAKVG